MNKKKLIIIICFSIFLALIILSFAFLLMNKSVTNTKVSDLKDLPIPEITGGARG